MQALVVAHPPQLGAVPARGPRRAPRSSAGAGVLEAAGAGQQPHDGLLGGGVLIGPLLVGDVAHHAHEAGRQAVPAGDRSTRCDVDPALGAVGGDEAMREPRVERARRAAAARTRAAWRPRSSGCTNSVARPAERLVDVVAGGARPGRVQDTSSAPARRSRTRSRSCSPRRAGGAPRCARRRLLGLAPRSGRPSTTTAPSRRPSAAVHRPAAGTAARAAPRGRRRASRRRRSARRAARAAAAPRAGPNGVPSRCIIPKRVRPLERVQVRVDRRERRRRSSAGARRRRTTYTRSPSWPSSDGEEAALLLERARSVEPGGDVADDAASRG